MIPKILHYVWVGGVHPSEDGMESVRFGDGGVVFPWTYFLPGGGYTNHRYDASWLDPWLRKVWLRRIGRFFWYRKYSRDGYMRLRVLGFRARFRAAGKYAEHMGF